MNITVFALLLATASSPVLANEDVLADLANKAATDEACVMKFGTSYMDIASIAWQNLEAEATNRGMDIFGSEYLNLHTAIMTDAQEHSNSAKLTAYCENLLKSGG